jgi:DNA repair exonuclease SbcCD ATPase subunit
MKLKRIYHIADIHIRNVKRHKEYRTIFEKLFEEIRKRGTEDSIIYLAGDIAHAKLEMSPELVKEISWLFTECSKHCLTIMIAGNHDCNMNNADRLDVLTPIVDALKLKNFVYLKDTQVWSYGDVGFGVFSIFDNKDNWPKANDWALQPFDKKIALFHGPVDHSQTDVGYVVSSRHFTVDMFDGYDLALLGDIHKRQELISPSGCKCVYAGALVQQNFGESIDKHGFLVWDMDTLTYEAIDIKNEYGFYTLNVDGGIVPDVQDMPKYAHLRVKLSNTDTVNTKKAVMEIKRKYKIKDFTVIRTDSVSKLKTGDRNNKFEFEDVSDLNYQSSLINDYLTRMFTHLTPEDINAIQAINADINNRIKHDDIQRNIFWKPIKFEFSNMFSYGEDNKIDFTKINGLMGLFAPNASGKSSLFDAISFCLYDKCSRAFKATNIMNNRKDTFVCQLQFEINGVNYFIRREARTVNKGKNVKVDVQFWKMENDMAVSLNGTERRDTDAIIEQYVGRYEDFVLTALSLQNNNALFIDKSQTERKELLAQFMGLNIFDKLHDEASNDIKEVSALIKNFKRTDFTSELNEKVVELKEKEGELKILTDKVQTLNDEKDIVIETIVNLNKELNYTNINIDISKLNTKKIDIASELVEIESTKEKLSLKLDETKTIKTQISGSLQNKKIVNDKDVADAIVEYNELCKTKVGIENEIKMLSHSIKVNSEKLSHLETHEYDPNCKFCMNNVFVKDALKTKELLQSQNSELDKLKITKTEYEEKINGFGDIKTIWEEYNLLKEKYEKSCSLIEKFEAEIDGLTTKEEFLQHQLEVVNSDIKKYYENEAVIKKNKQIEGQLTELSKQKSKIDEDIKSVSADVSVLTAKIGTIESYIETCKNKIAEVRELEERYFLYECYLDAIKKDGIPYELISKALPIIENEVNNILGQVVDFSVLMDMDGKNINAKIVYDDQEWALEMCSGMEKFISGIAIRVSLINICNLPRPNFLVIDEGFGSLDSDNISSLFMMMQYLKTQFDFIWIISHLDQMRDMVDGIIEIKKVNGFSLID